MTIKRKCCGECFYCEQEFQTAPRHEHDHAPIPKDSGGLDIVAACITCHDLKDRRTLDRWPLEMYVLAMKDLQPTDFTEADVWPARWDSLATSARLVWAKWAAMKSRQIHGIGVDGTPDAALLLRN